jgi:hypothetical protein
VRGPDVPRNAVPASMIDRMMSAMVLALRGLFIKSPGLRVPPNELGTVFIMSTDFGVPLVLGQAAGSRQLFRSRAPMNDCAQIQAE